MTKQIFELWRYISRKRRFQLVLLLLSMVMVSLSEVLSIGAFIPFLGILIAPDKIFSLPLVGKILALLGIHSLDGMILPITIIFVSLISLAGFSRMALLWLNTKVSYAIGADLKIEVFRRVLYQPYSYHLSINSSEVAEGIRKAGSVINVVFIPIFNLVTSLMIAVSVVSFLIILDPVVSLTAIFGFGAIYILISMLVKKRIEFNSKIHASEVVFLTKAIYEGLGGIRDILLDGNQKLYCDVYEKSDQKMNKANAENSYIGISPRYIVEILGVSLMAVFAAYLASSSNNLVEMVPVLGSFALGAQRMLPALQIGYNAWTAMKGGSALLRDALEFLALPMPEQLDTGDVSRIDFNDKASLVDVGFRYNDDGPWILKSLNLEIPRGTRVGFVGTTGSGKSTLLDIIMRILSPVEGQIKVDGVEINQSNLRSWQQCLAHVPQSIYLSDTSIKENIAFGIPLDQIDEGRMKAAAKQAQIDTFLEGLADGYNTIVGERGVRLSGGQRQRIGIARTLYKNPSVIVFDEATSALDNETEKAVMESIDCLSSDLTILIIAHRISTVKNCDFIVELKEGQIARSGKYSELFGKVSQDAVKVQGRH